MTDEQIKECFKDHIAKVIQIDGDLQLLTWARPDTKQFEINYMFYEKKLMITGTMRTAAFKFDFKPRWNSDWQNISLDCLANRLLLHEDGKYTWSKEDAIKDLKEEYSDRLNCLTYIEFVKLAKCLDKDKSKIYSIVDDNDILELPYSYLIDDDLLLQLGIALKHAQTSASATEYRYGIQNDPEFDDFNDFWDWGYKCGLRLNEDLKWYLFGLQMAYIQLKDGEINVKEN